MMKKSGIFLSLILIVAAALAFYLAVGKKASSKELRIIYPFKEALFPPEFPAPTFEWRNVTGNPSISWEVTLATGNKKHIIKDITQATTWTPSEASWDSLKLLSDYGKIFFTINISGNGKPYDKRSFSISRDSVGAPILYRQLTIPFYIAEKELDSMNYILIDPGSKDQPHLAMRGFPVCGNCHSFSADGSVMGLDLDGGRRDKGGYFLTEIKDTVMFDVNTYMSWSKLEKRSTFGSFSKLSPDGRYVATTVKDRVVSLTPPMNTAEGFSYSLLFIPVNGHLAVYDRQTKVVRELPGANLPEYVQTNAFWTPDGKNIIFARAKALPRDSTSYYEIAVQNQDILDKFLRREISFKFDLYTIPFNNGEGGTAVPITGASNNGKSNFFPAVSPDGKWLVYCQADEYMHLMPDSRLYIIPVEGGKPRMLDCNLFSLNSWHAWSPNSKWLVFVSKGLSYYTDMFLTHIDGKGNASIPVLMDKARAYKRVCNYPEFINLKADEKFVMEYDYVELAHIRNALRERDYEKAKSLYYKLMDQDPFFFKEDYETLTDYLQRMGLPDEARKCALLAETALNSFAPEEE